MNLLDKVALFYEKCPYPALPWHAIFTSIVKKDDLPLINYFAGYSCAFGSIQGAAKKPKILVAGCGTFEPIAVAIANPGAEIVAIDISKKSLKKLERLAKWKRIQLQTKLMDLQNIEGKFDYIIATGVLHHLENPQDGLSALVRVSHAKTIFRFMLYSKRGRDLIYGAKQLAAKLGIQRPKEFRKMIHSLPADHPYRIYFHLYSDAKTDTGLADGFLHPCDQAFTPSQLRNFLGTCNLEVAKFLHRPEGQPNNVSEFSQLDQWQKLELLDLMGDFEENFLFFACNRNEMREKKGNESYLWNPALPKAGKLFSKILGKEISFDKSMRNPQNRDELIQALFLLPGENK